VKSAWAGAAVEFSSPAAQPPYVAAALDAGERTIAAMMKPGSDGRSFLDHVRERDSPLLEAVEAARPPDVTDDRWLTAVDGLKVFPLAGHGDEAESLGWPETSFIAFQNCGRKSGSGIRRSPIRINAVDCTASSKANSNPRDLPQR
jgi:hypothetical protein